MEKTKLHFFPFNTITKKPVERFNNIQGLYVESYPEFLAEVFSNIPDVQVYPYCNNFTFTEDEEKKEVGFSKWSLDSLRSMVKQRNNPFEGFGVTGGLFFDDKKGCFIRFVIFDVGTKSILKKSEAKFKLDKIFSITMNSAIALIVRTCQLEKYMKESLIIPESLTRKAKAFLIFLQIKDMWRRKGAMPSVFLPSVFTTERILESFHSGFREQPDFLVLHLMFLDFVEELAASERDKFEKKIQEIDGLIESKQEAADGYLKHGIAYQDKGQYDQAISAYSKAIETNPTLAEAYYNRGFAYSRKGQYDQAISDFSKVIELNPGDVDAYYNRAASYFKKAEYVKAWDDVKKAQDLGSTIDPRFLKALREALGK